MPRFAANLSMLFAERPFLERFAAAAEAGFTGVEYLFPYAHDAADIRAALEASGVEQVLFNLPPGDWEAGERGIAALPGREADLRAGVEQALDYARALSCPRVHMMAGIPPADADPEECEAVYLRNLRHAAGEAARAGVTLLIEPINPVDMPGYFLTRQAQARRLLAAAGADSARVQLDLYHVQMTEGRLAHALDEQWPRLGHVQIAGVPGRHEPDADGEINWPWLFAELDRRGYAGWVGCEYKPRAGTSEGLGWFNRARRESAN
ncbi:2-oxo-tetronate isomerase [Sediminicurvatus halobius]|uniref:Hydroxypyruvate isomerase n=1 Tax=Sediminicurvatus halobius TaxID=2182432 RepID=A0A2U2MX24_9GAMM|nr:2-oxo-tetronate isomerase [Spiribacter halobius]PWG61411.1 hydroxypyruvate isomerase [Spiribacter halobius]UEX78547.1 hydroxypyruvate isomerase family protein [Spiribacter halobius]